MKMNEVAQVFEQKNEGQGFAGVVVAVFVTILIGSVLLSPIQSTVNNAKTVAGTVGGGGALNTTVDNLPLLFAVLLLVAVLAAMVAIIS